MATVECSNHCNTCNSIDFHFWSSFGGITINTDKEKCKNEEEFERKLIGKFILFLCGFIQSITFSHELRYLGTYVIVGLPGQSLPHL